MPTTLSAYSSAFLLLLILTAANGLADHPQQHDARLKLTLFAESPQIVTPIGMAIDHEDRVFVIESHTHSPPKDYAGPESDRIKVFQDTDGDGESDRVSIFAKGIHQAMNLAFSKQGDLYAVCAREVIKFIDLNDDGVSDQKVSIARLETKQRYAHNSLLSITFDNQGWMYVGRGNTGSDHYRFVAADGSYVEGFGDGGSVFRLQPDGTQVSEYATGFWNPFDLKFDRFGRLLLVDNDPDARGPNRLLQVVRGGDYGYKSMFGGAGTHPFQGWDGELPGTLGYLSGTGEAPSGLIDCRRSSLPTDYENSVLVTVWNENTIERHQLDPQTGKLVQRSVFVSGDKNFRPVALDCDSQGNLFITDWMLVDYPNHGRGRIWRVSNNQRESQLGAVSNFAPYLANAQQKTIDRLILGESSPTKAQLIDHDRPLVRHAAIMRLSRKDQSEFRHELQDGNAEQRMASLLASRRAFPRDRRAIAPWLGDPDPEIRRAALMWAGLSKDLTLRGPIDATIEIPPVTPKLFETYLATHELLTPEFVTAWKQKETNAKKLPRSLEHGFLVRLAKRDSLPSNVRSLAIKRFDGDTIQQQRPWLRSLVDGRDPALAIAAMDILRDDPQAMDAILSVAIDLQRETLLRLHAIAALSDKPDIDDASVQSLLNDPSSRIVTQTRRSFPTHPAAGTAVKNEAKPSTVKGWQEVLAGGGDPVLGQYVFREPRFGCIKCHRMDGHGDTLGPVLSGVGSSKTRSQIITAIIDPSAEFAPQYQAWIVVDVDGRVHRGLQLDHKAKGAIVLTLDTGENRYFSADEIEAYQALKASLMPDGLVNTMTVEQVRDLVAFLSQTGGESE